jgi:hypothetical protein
LAGLATSLGQFSAIDERLQPVSDRAAADSLCRSAQKVVERIGEFGPIGQY